MRESKKGQTKEIMAKEKILVIDDEPSIRKYLHTLLDVDGFDVTTVPSGSDALEFIATGAKPDFVILDVLMPEMDGLEATRQICARWQKAERPRIIAMTANAMQGDREMCLAAGMDDYVSKPIRIEELVQALARSAKLS